ncbi:MAG TPA: FMN-binding protein [Micromonosporaceae bacterium]|jgi:uncharacterized protein with FMN-binding domain
MRRITLWLIATVAIVVLLFSYRTSTDRATAEATGPSGAQPPGVVAAPAPSTATGPVPSSAPATKSPMPASATRTVNGTVTQTRWGPVQVQVKLSGSTITDVTALIYPSGNGHDAQINAYALPQLRRQVLSAQSADIDGVSGATVTSDGYRRSLQAALDAAHVKG